MERLDRCKSMERRKPYSQTLSVENESTHKNHKTSLRLRKCNSSVGSAATFPSRARLSSKPYNCSFAARELHLIPGLRPDLGMIQQERQNNIINILGGHSYAM